jgi:DNA-binding beta-propeller fold protein YncE
MTRPYALLRAGFPYLRTIGMRRITDNPVDLALGEEGRLYCICRGDVAMHIRRFSWDDEDLGTIGGRGTGDGQFVWPSSLVRNKNENLLVSDEALHRITVFDKDGKFLSRWGEHGEGEGQLNRPSGLALEADENLFVVDTMNHRVQKFTYDGQFLGAWGGFGTSEGQFNMPWGICVDDLGDVYVADWRNNRIQKFSADGEFVMAIGSTGDGERQFNRPARLTVDSDGDIYVADWANDRVQQFDKRGRYVDTFIGDATLGKMALTYVRTNAKVLRLRETTTLGPSKRLRGPAAVQVDAEGHLYIADYGSHRIQVYRKEAYPLRPEELLPEPTAPSLSTV